MFKYKLRHGLQHLLLFLKLEVFFLVDVGESPFLGNDDLLATGKLVPGAAESLHNDWCVVFLRPDGKDNLADVYTGNRAVRLAPCTTHTCLEPDQE